LNPTASEDDDGSVEFACNGEVLEKPVLKELAPIVLNESELRNEKIIINLVV
jgi:hypothetical protein